MSTTIKAITTAGVSLAMIAATTLPALASTGPHYFATAGHQFGPPVTGDANQAIDTLTYRYGVDPALFAVTAAHCGFSLPGGAKWLIAHPGKWKALARQFGAYLHAHVVEEVNWDGAYRTMFAVAHRGSPTTFGWESMPAKPSDVLVFNGPDGEFYLRANCGGQIYVPAKPIPLPSKPKACKTAGKGSKGNHAPSCAPCQPGQHLFNVPGVGGMCLCPTTVHVIVSNTRTVSVQVITTVTNTTSTTTEVQYGVCPPKHHCKVK